MFPESGYYPPGAENDPNAPYNEPPKPDKVNVEVTASYSVSRTFTIKTNDYIPIVEEDYDVYIDEDGNKYVTGGKFESQDFSDTNWEKAFNEDDDALGIPELLETLSKLADEKISLFEAELEETTIPERKRKLTKWLKKWQNIKQSCEGWTVDEFVVEQE